MKKLRRKAKSLKSKKILLIVSGSIAAYKVGDLIKLLRDAGADVTVILTKYGEKFVTPLTLRALSGNPVYCDAFTLQSPHDVLHTALAEENDLVLVAPASANFIARAAAGMADDLGACVLLATQKPVVIAPAMNDNMYNHELTQANIEKLRSIGYSFIEPIKGDLVCGKHAVGHIAEPEKILESLRERFA